MCLCYCHHLFAKAIINSLYVLGIPLIRYAAEDRCGVVVKGANQSGNIAGTCPLKDNDILLTTRALDDSNEVRNTIAVVNELSKEMRQILLSHPANPKCAPGGKNIASVVLLGDSGI